MRKVPTQLRSKARVEAMLDAAEAMIIESGVSSLTMEGIAEKAGVSIGSLYQYFHSREEIFQQLGRRYYAELETLVEPYLSSMTRVTDFIVRIEQSIRICWEFTSDNAGYQALFFDVIAWEAVREVDWQDTEEHARRMAGALQPLLPNIEYEDLFAFCMILGDSAASSARLASRFPEMRERIFAQFIQLVTDHCLALSRTDAEAEVRLRTAQMLSTGGQQAVVTEAKEDAKGDVGAKKRKPRTAKA